MYHLYKTLETPGGGLETSWHRSFHKRHDAEQAGQNLRLLYPWIKYVEVRWEEEERQLAVPRKMAPSLGRGKIQKRKSS